MPGFTDIENVYGHAVSASIKQDGLDLAYIYVPTAVASAVLCTQHVFKASSVTHTQDCQEQGTIKAVVINSGNANAVTGEQGSAATKTLAAQAATHLGLNENQVAVASTGIIGVQLPLERINLSFAHLFSDIYKKSPKNVAEAILTTDLTSKEVWVERQIGKHTLKIAGITKGSGMIAPQMATTLAFIVTNANVSQTYLQDCFKQAIDASYNMMSVDTDTSTNDMALCFATGECAINEKDTEEAALFQAALTEACIDLARQIALDGEGATKRINVHVTGALTEDVARILAKQVVDSPLVKTAIHGEDPNWGRIVMALGKGPVEGLNPELVSISIGDYVLVEQGQPKAVARDMVRRAMQGTDVHITIDCASGEAQATAWGCDLTKGYIDINTEYN